MSETSPTLAKDPTLPPAQDFARLRRAGIGFIEQLGSRWWTDYNVHDPGITILEALCYAITDLGYRLDGKIEDILAPQTPAADPRQPYPQQAFFTARQILTINPVTPDDFRRLLIDLDRVRNAWVIERDCTCETTYFAWCEDDVLLLSHSRPEKTSSSPVKVTPRGLYEALVELEADPESGDLNDRKIESRAVFHDSDGAHVAILEVRFPDLASSDRAAWTRLLTADEDFADPTKFQLTLAKFGATPTFNVLTDLPTDAARDSYVRAHWKTIFYASFVIDIIATGERLHIDNATLRLLGSAAAKNAATMASLRAMLQQKDAAGFIHRYRQKAQRAQRALTSVKQTLHRHRNLAEDFCLISTIGIEEVAVCADVEVKAGADIERVQAEIWFAIEQYLNPAIRFRALQECLDGGQPVEDVFDGPELASGFLDAADLENSTLRTALRTSDILNRLMDIDGVIAVNQLLLTKYDSEGNVVKGAADPQWIDGVPIFDPGRISATWLLFINRRHLPRLYLNQSRFLFYKNGLPFQARADEAFDVLHQLRGAAERPRNPHADTDLPVPQGAYRDLGDYFPVQYGLPQVYGVGPQGLPATATARRKARARQLQGYLAVFEQLFVNSLAQLANTANLFSLDPSVAHTYFVRRLDETVLSGFDAIADQAMTESALQAMVETPSEFYERRNRFLDHLLARFGEDFSEYALLMTDVAGAKVAFPKLIKNKTAFLKRYPEVSHDRDKASDYTRNACAPDNYPGIKKRVTLLLGTPDLSFFGKVETSAGDQHSVSYELTDFNGAVWLAGELMETAASAAEAEQAAYRTLLQRMVSASSYEIVEASGQFHVKLHGDGAATLGQGPQSLACAAEADAICEALVQWSSNERLIVVEHLLLRPKFPGDALYPACVANGCATCGDEDPYSFRLTFVMPGWLTQYADNLDLRDFAKRTIQQETPSHLVAKVCWVGNDEATENLGDEVTGNFADLVTRGRPFERFERAWRQWLWANATIDWAEEQLATRVRAMLQARSLSSAKKDSDLCVCAESILRDYGAAYFQWMKSNIDAGNPFNALTPFVPPAITLCAGIAFQPGTAEAIDAFLGERYAAYREPSYRLWIVVILLAALRNTYPQATLHDCDDGGDVNPVRLDTTALGDHPLRDNRI